MVTQLTFDENLLFSNGISLNGCVPILSEWCDDIDMYDPNDARFDKEALENATFVKPVNAIKIV